MCVLVALSHVLSVSPRCAKASPNRVLEDEVRLVFPASWYYMKSPNGMSGNLSKKASERLVIPFLPDLGAGCGLKTDSEFYHQKERVEAWIDALTGAVR